MADEARPRILIVDDHRLFAEVIRTTLLGLGMDVLPVATTAEEGLAAAEHERPQLVLMDIGLREHNGLAVGRKIMDALPGTKVVALTAHKDRRDVREASKLGFKGYVLKDTPIRQFVAAINAVLAGQAVIPGQPTRAPTSGMSPEQRDASLLIDQLTAREREILAFLAQGARGEDIAQGLGVSPNTIRTHVQNILLKLQVHSRLEAATFATRHGIGRPQRR